jgi:hypothetical protein
MRRSKKSVAGFVAGFTSLLGLAGCCRLPYPESAYPPVVVSVTGTDRVVPDPVYVKAGSQEAHWYGCAPLQFDDDFRALFSDFRCDSDNRHCHGTIRRDVARRTYPYHVRVSEEKSASLDPGMIVW